MIVLEFNELCSDLIGEFMTEGLLPNFRKLYDRSTVFTSEAGESPPNLEPWIQWPSVHSGMTYGQHQVFNLGDGEKLREKSVAEILSNAGVPVGVFGSMNVNYRKLRGYFMPDPWHKSASASPESLQPFYRVIAKQVQESSRNDALARADMLCLGFFMLRNGLSFGTALRAARQLLDERLDPGVQWRRASLLDALQYDLFRRANKRHGVRFATFFSNSTAHYQHYYWRNMQPELFELPPPASDHRSLPDAILFGYRSMDRLIGRALKDYPHAVIVLCTALSQRAWTDTSKCTFRPRDFGQLLALAGIDPASVAVKPVMAEQFHLDFATADACTHAANALQALSIDERKVMYVQQEGEKSLLCGCDINDARVEDRNVVRADGKTRRFSEIFYMIHTMRSGRHDPRGLFWLGNGRHQIVADSISILDIAPTILNYFNVAKPHYMHGRVLAA